MSADKTDIKGIRRYRGPAGGWDALKSVTKHLYEQDVLLKGNRTLLEMNKPEGFDCPGCAWPDPNHHSSFEYCENGAKAIAWETTAKRADGSIFDRYTVSELMQQTDHWLEDQGRLTDPLVYDPASDRYKPIAWGDAYALIARELAALADPNEAEFYASGRTSNEAAFLYQLFVRAYGTNNFPDCSNMCHEPSSVGLPKSIGVGKGTVLLEDFEHCDLILSFGHNPGTNHPRMLGTLREVAKRGARIAVFNPIRERGLERFADPKSIREMATFGSTQLATDYFQLRIGGDIALLKGMMKCLFAWDALDHDFIAAHTAGFDALKADVEAAPWDEIEAISGLSRDDITRAAKLYANAKSVILCYGMGITQHHNATETVQQLMNLLLLRGNVGRPGAGICPLRGHSNVQGDRTVGIWEKPAPWLLDALEREFGFAPPRDHGHTIVEAIEAMIEGRSKVFIGLGGNVVMANSDPVKTMEAMRKQALTVWISTKLNRSHLVHGRQALILPCLGRTEIDAQQTGPQSITVEDSMSMVHASMGMNTPASPNLKSEPAIIAGIAKATLAQTQRPVRIDWDWLVADYDRIRDLIARVIPGFENFNEKIRTPGGFYLGNAARERQWKTANGKANFLVFPRLAADPNHSPEDGLVLTTVRSHDQYNTTIYGYDDRYRGVFGRRDVLFMNSEDIVALGLEGGDAISLETIGADPAVYRADGFIVVPYDVPQGCCVAYYPEANPLIPLENRDAVSGTPAYKAVPVRVSRHVAG